jgi:lipid-binding SYLF domain-containing protein
MRHLMKRRLAMTALAGVLAVSLGGCAGGLVGSKEKKKAFFDALERDTLAQLIKEQPKAEQELAESVGYLVAEQDLVKIPVIGWASGAGVVVEKGTGNRFYLRIPELHFGYGAGVRVQKVLLIFQDINRLRDLADGKWYVGAAAGAAAKAGDKGVAGSISGQMKKADSTYVLTDAGASATATVAMIRAQPYSIE